MARGDEHSEGKAKEGKGKEGGEEGRRIPTDVYRAGIMTTSSYGPGVTRRATQLRSARRASEGTALLLHAPSTEEEVKAAARSTGGKRVQGPTSVGGVTVPRDNPSGLPPAAAVTPSPARAASEPDHGRAPSPEGASIAAAAAVEATDGASPEPGVQRPAVPPSLVAPHPDTARLPVALPPSAPVLVNRTPVVPTELPAPAPCPASRGRPPTHPRAPRRRPKQKITAAATTSGPRLPAGRAGTVTAGRRRGTGSGGSDPASRESDPLWVLADAMDLEEGMSGAVHVRGGGGSAGAENNLTRRRGGQKQGRGGGLSDIHLSQQPRATRLRRRKGEQEMEEDEALQSILTRKRLQMTREAVAEEVVCLDGIRRARVEVAGLRQAVAAAGGKLPCHPKEKQHRQDRQRVEEAWDAFLKRNEERWKEQMERESRKEVESRVRQRAADARISRVEDIIASLSKQHQRQKQEQHQQEQHQQECQQHQQQWRRQPMVTPRMPMMNQAVAVAAAQLTRAGVDISTSGPFTPRLAAHDYEGLRWKQQAPLQESHSSFRGDATSLQPPSSTIAAGTGTSLGLPAFQALPGVAPMAAPPPAAPSASLLARATSNGEY